MNAALVQLRAGTVPLLVPSNRQARRRRLPDAARGMGIFVCATRGSGKSRLLGRAIAWGDFQREIPLVVLDPHGGTIDNLLDKIGQQPLAQRRELFKRITYINMSGQDGYVFPWPIYYAAREGERYSQQSRRFVSVVARSDPALRNASIYGLNSLGPIAKAAGIVLTALGFGITEMYDLVNNPTAWEHQFQVLEQEHPETRGAIARLRALGALRPHDRAQQVYSLLSKLSLFQTDTNYQAIFGASTPGIDWRQVVEQKRAVLIDFRHIDDEEVKIFCLLWIYNSFITFVKQRGHGSMHSPISFMVDELSYLAGDASDNDKVLAGDLNELVHRISRSHGVWLTLATQELFQLPAQVRQTVLSMGTVIFGQTSDDEAAEDLARRYFPYDPYKVKKSRTRWEQLPQGFGRTRSSQLISVGEDTTEFTKSEQNYLNSRVFRTLKKFHFLIGQSRHEGELPTELHPIHIEALDPGQFPENQVTEPLRAELMRRDGVKETKILRDIEQRLEQRRRARPASASAAEVSAGQPADGDTPSGTPLPPHRPRSRKPARPA